MAGRLAVEIQQRKPFKLLEEEAALNIVRTAEYLNQRSNWFFRQSDLSTTQYNILRIVRGAGNDGITCSEAAARMVTRDPDVTRLVDRLESRGLIARERSASDRRKVLIRLTKEGRRLVDSLDLPVSKMLRSVLGHLSQTKLRQVVEIMEEIRET